MLASVLISLLLAHHAYSFAIPFKLVPSGAVTVGGEPLAIIEHHFCVANITIGTPPQTFALAVDTTNAFSFIPDMTCKTGNQQDCFGKKRFDSTKSSTYVKNGTQFVDRGEEGTANGFLGSDVFRLGQDAMNMIVIPMQTFGQATALPQRFDRHNGIDGVLGLGFQANALLGVKPVINNAMATGALTNSTISIWLEDQYQSSDNGTAGVIYYGGFDPVHCVPTKAIYPIASNRFYQITTPSFTTGNFTYAIKTQTYLDTTQDLIFVPRSVAQAIITQLGLTVTPENLPAPVPCNANIQLSFNFPQGAQTVTAKNLIYPTRNGQCMLHIRSDNNRFVLGTPFFRGRCTYFDSIAEIVGFADAKSHM